ncbi:hypothetical protein LCGC14_1079060 [marine sediment metagenome]|uniref:Polymerase nucleotidyl transferase domain-containing protein n=1 Tax=marine sediment metagenome TaxID=412755 RepID=A0A0F9PZ42_9ZZZZ
MEQKNIILSGKLLEKHKRQLKELQNFVYKIKSIFKDKLVSVILIGSRARLDFNIRSDIDLILVGQWSNYVLFDRIDEIKDKVDLPLLPIDFFLYKPDEILKLIDRGNPMILQGFVEGNCLLNDNYYQTIQKIILKMISNGKLSKEKNLWKVHK